MASPIILTVFPAKDLEKAKSVYTAFLGVEPYADSPYYVGYKAGEMEIGLDPRGMEVVSYIEVADIQASLQELETAGAVLHMEPKDVGGGLLVAQVKDAEGNVLGLRQAAK